MSGLCCSCSLTCCCCAILVWTSVISMKRSNLVSPSPSLSRPSCPRPSRSYVYTNLFSTYIYTLPTGLHIRWHYHRTWSRRLHRFIRHVHARVLYQAIRIPFSHRISNCRDGISTLLCSTTNGYCSPKDV